MKLEKNPHTNLYSCVFENNGIILHADLSYIEDKERSMTFIVNENNELEKCINTVCKEEGTVSENQLKECIKKYVRQSLNVEAIYTPKIQDMLYIELEYHKQCISILKEKMKNLNIIIDK